MNKKTTKKLEKPVKAKKTTVKKDGPVNPTEQADIVSPKYHFANQVRELFKRDPEIKMSFNEMKCILDMEVDNEIKCLAIRRLLPEKRTFVDGDITINVKLRHDRFGGPTFLKDTVYEAFKGNPLFDYQYWWADPEATNNPFSWVVMKPEVIAYPESDLHQIYGSTIALPEDLATAVLIDSTDNIFYCTDDMNPEHPMPDHNARKFNE